MPELIISNDPNELSYSEKNSMDHVRKLAHWYQHSRDETTKHNLLSKLLLCLEEAPALKNNHNLLRELDGIPLPFGMFERFVLGAQSNLGADEYVEYLLSLQNANLGILDENIESFLQRQVKHALERALSGPPSSSLESTPRANPDTPSRAFESSLNISTPKGSVYKRTNQDGKGVSRALQASLDNLDTDENDCGPILVSPIPKVARFANKEEGEGNLEPSD